MKFQRQAKILDLIEQYEIETQEELSELARILAQRREVPPSWEDVEGYCSILENEGGFADPAAIRNASEEDLRRYLEELKRRK